MARRDPRFTGIDLIRMFENNLGVADKRLVVAFFYSTIPVKEPKVDALRLLLDLLALVPVAGTVGAIFSITLQTAQVAADIADLFGFEFEEEEVELARVKLELMNLREDFRMQRNELLRLQVLLDQANERIAALLATQELLEADVQVDVRDDVEEILQNVDFLVVFIRRERGKTFFVDVLLNRVDEIRGELLALRGKL